MDRSSLIRWLIHIVLDNITNEFGTMRPIALSMLIVILLALCIAPILASFSHANPPNSQEVDGETGAATLANADAVIHLPVSQKPNSTRALVLVSSLTVFVLSIFIGFEIIAKVPPTLHTPLMSGSNAISGITVIGAIIACGFRETGFGSLLGLVAIVLAMINVVGGFVVTHRMLLMFKKR